MESLEDYLEALASISPTPGGGSAATIVGAMAAALVAMVARITLGNPKFSAQAEAARGLAHDADHVRARFLAARLDDERAYGEVVRAMALPRSTDDEKAGRAMQLQAALGEAARAPLDAAGLARETLELAVRARDLGNANLMSDVDCAASFARAALEASAANVRVNHLYMKDADLAAYQAHELAAIESDSAPLYARASAG